MDYLKPILGWSGLHSIPGSCLALQYSHGICSAGLISWFWKCQFQSSSRGPGSTPSPAPLPLHGIACLAWSGELAPSHAPLTDLKNSACVCTCHIFYRQGSFMCNQCKWPMYVLCFINSHLSLLLPATALPYQDSSARPSVLGFLCLLHLISEICFIQRLSLSLSAFLWLSGWWVHPHFRWQSLSGMVYFNHYPDLEGAGWRERPLCMYHLSCVWIFQQVGNFKNISWKSNVAAETGTLNPSPPPFQHF